MFSSIKHKIMIPTLLVILVLMSATSLLIYHQVQHMIHLKELTTVEVIRVAMENGITARQTAEEVMEREMIGQAVLASYIAEDPSVDFGRITELAERSGIDEFWIADGRGQVRLTTAGESVDFNFGADPDGQAYEFMQLLTGEKTAVSQPAQPRTIDPKVYKYVGVGGWHSPAIVQVGRDGGRLTELEEQIGVRPLIANLQQTIGEDMLFAAILNGDGSVDYATDEALATSAEFAAFAAEGMSRDEGAVRSMNVGGVKLNLHLTRLSNGQAFVVALSFKVLSHIMTIMVSATIISAALIVILAFIIVDRQIRRIRQLETAMQEISRGDGDLTQRIAIQSKDEIGTLAFAFNSFVEKVHALVKEARQAVKANSESVARIREQTDQTAASSGEVTQAIQEIAAAASKQASDVEDGMLIIHKMAEAIVDTDQQAERLYDNSRLIRERQDHGVQAVAALEATMAQYGKISREVAENLSRLIQDIDGIQETAQSIRGISQQTGILALNASIEAARAGEAGRGFSVVAAEVRKLAEQANTASERIQSVLENVAHSVMRTTGVMNDAERALGEQTARVNDTSQAFRDIADALQTMNRLIADIRAVTRQLAEDKEKLVAFIESASAVTEETAAGTEEVLASVESQLQRIRQVAEQANELDRMMLGLTGTVERFQV